VSVFRLRCVVGLQVLVLFSACGQSPVDERPSLVLVLADDQRFDTLSCAGGVHVQTPSLDQIAAQGAFFERAYVTTSLCCPARAGILTGLYAHQTQIRNNEDDVDFLASGLGFPELLQEAGYSTGFFGKWHIPNPGAMPQRGFDRWVSFDGQGQYIDETFNIDGERQQLPGFNTDRLFDLALEWIEEQGERPYLAIISLKNLHRPYIPPRRHRGSLADQDWSLPESAHDPVEELPAFIQRVRTTLRNRFFDDEGLTHEASVRGYYQMMLSFDDNVGRLSKALDENGTAQRTALFVTSDGGFMWGEHGLYRKRTAYEPSIHVPLLVRYPQEIAEGSTLSELVLNIDIAPTLLDLAGVPIPAVYQGRSLRPLWGAGALDWRKDLLYFDSWGKFMDGPQELAVCTARYKYVRYRRGEIEEALYDLETDPDERRNLAKQDEHASRLAMMAARMAELLVEFKAPPTWMDAVQPGSVKNPGR
jgi:N-acetylglucosamine-6-sulfatase